MISKFGTKVKGVLQFVFSRLVVTGVLLLLQIVWLFVLFYRLSDYADWINAVGLTLSCKIGRASCRERV